MTRAHGAGGPSPAHECEHSDAIVASFLDASCAEPSGFLADHLDACPRCAQVLRVQRRIDALIASRTSTELDDARADEFLAFLRDAPGPEPVAAAPRAPQRGRVAGLVAAGALAASLAFAFGLGSEPGVDPAPASPSAEGPSAPGPSPLGARRAEPVDVSPRGGAPLAAAPAKGFALPDDFSIRRKPREKRAPTRSDELRAYQGYYVAGMRSDALARRAHAVFDHEARLAQPSILADASVSACAEGPVLAVYDARLQRAAALWYGHGIADHEESCARIGAWLGFVLRTRGEDRRAIVRGLCHDAADLVARLPGAGRASFAGALGLRVTRRELRAWSAADCRDYVREALRTGDEARVDAAIAFYVLAARKRPELAATCAELSLACDAGRGFVHDRIDRYRRQLRRQSDENALDRLVEALYEARPPARQRTD